MHFDFQHWKPIIQQEFDAVLESFPTDLSHVTSQVPTGGDAYVRKLALIQAAAEGCPVYIYDHFPFAFEVSLGMSRGWCHVGIGELCRQRSGVDFSSLDQLQEALRGADLGHFGTYTDFLHRTLDHDKLLARGFKGVYEDCLQLNATETDPDKKAYREVLMEVCRCIEKLGLRLRQQAVTQLEHATDEDARHNLQRIVNSRNTPWEPAQTMYDALNSLMCASLFISQLDGLNVHAFGSVDRLIQPFYQRDLEAGRITKEEAYYLIQCFLYKTDAHIHYSENHKEFDNGVTVMVGGCDPEGNPVYNAVTDLILRAYLENKFVQPKLNARAGTYSPRAYLEKLAELMQSGLNNLIIQNDDYIVPMFQRMGLSPEDARRYIGGGCQEVVCTNQVHSRAFFYLNLPQILLDTLAGPTQEIHHKLYRYGQFRMDSFQELQESFLANLRSYIRLIAETFAPFEQIHDQINPEPLLSCFTADCVSRGQDITQGGAKYYHKTLSLFGFGTLCDSLLSLKKAYENGTVLQLLEAVKANFEGFEPLRKQLQDSTNRFGHSPEADKFAEMLADKLAQVSRGIYNAQGVEYRTSLFSYLMFHVFANTAATPDGRRQGETLSRQMNMAKLPEPTAATYSMSSICHADFCDVGMFDIALPMNDSVTYRQVLTDYIRTCLELKIPVLQPNMVNRAMLLEERQHKGTHPDLVVRICGYSALFGLLSPDMQDEVIARIQA